MGYWVLYGVEGWVLILCGHVTVGTAVLAIAAFGAQLTRWIA